MKALIKMLEQAAIKRKKIKKKKRERIRVYELPKTQIVFFLQCEIT